MDEVQVSGTGIIDDVVVRLNPPPQEDIDDGVERLVRPDTDADDAAWAHYCVGLGADVRLTATGDLRALADHLGG